LIKTNLATNTFAPEKLNSDTTYYWKVVAKDGKGGETEGNVWSFTTLRELTIEWLKTFGGSYDKWANSIQQTHDGGYIVAGLTYSNDGDVSDNHGGVDCWVVKLGY
jgi:hypothetical protein